MNTPLFIVTDDGMIARMDPSVVLNPNDVLARMASKDFTTVFDFNKFNVVVSSTKEGYLTEPISFHLSVTSKNTCVFWSYIPGLPFDTYFSAVEERDNSIRQIPEYLPSYQAATRLDLCSKRLWWDASIVSSVDSDLILRPLLAVSVDHRARNLTMYILFNIISVSKNSSLGNFLPPIPNVFADGKVCMGGAFDHNMDLAIGEKSLDERIQYAIDWFFNSKMNSDLITDSFDRESASKRLFGWSDSDSLLPPTSSIMSILTTKVGNYYVDGLPLNDKRFASGSGVKFYKK